ncbi:rhomboid-related protein 2-like isoform X2 [Lycorma delicatula]|uniref:rhomboid-related protein 2-like isoform X2 n=1 Tax=Lycorma delicatula TaxID=130591 RepID=UPI003F514553
MSRHDVHAGCSSYVSSTGLRTVEDYDTDGDGKLSLQELYAQINSPGFSHDIPDEVIQNIFKLNDSDSDGYIDFNEFVAMLETEVGRHILNKTLNQFIKHTVVPRKKRVIRSDRGIREGDYEEQYTCSPPPICMPLISTIEVVFFIYDLLACSVSSENKNDSVSIQCNFGCVGEMCVYIPKMNSQIWRFITYAFIHADTFHLFSNVTVQLVLGISLEMVHGWWRVLIIYLAGILSGSLATSIFDSKYCLLGASGGVYALITAHFSTIILNWSEMEYRKWLLIVISVLIALNSVPSVLNKLIFKAEDVISFETHAAGAVAGLLVGVYVLRNLEVHSWENVLKWICFALYIILIVVAIFYNIVS